MTRLIDELKKLPGIGSKNAQRLAFHILRSSADDADALAREWLAAGVEVHMPEDTEWGQHEGAIEDPDGNVVRFGSPIGRAH